MDTAMSFSERPAAAAGLQALPVELLLAVLGSLKDEPSALLRLRCTCRGLAAVALHPSLWERVVVGRASLAAIPWTSLAALLAATAAQASALGCRGLRSLSIDPAHLADTSDRHSALSLILRCLERLPAHTASLAELRLGVLDPAAAGGVPPPLISGPALGDLLPHLAALGSLSISGRLSGAFNALLRLPPSNPTLKHLSLDLEPPHTPEPLLAIPGGRLLALETLELRGLGTARTFAPLDPLSLARAAPRLRSLHLGDSWALVGQPTPAPESFRLASAAHALPVARLRISGLSEWSEPAAPGLPPTPAGFLGNLLLRLRGSPLRALHLDFGCLRPTDWPSLRDAGSHALPGSGVEVLDAEGAGEAWRLDGKGWRRVGGASGGVRCCCPPAAGAASDS